MEKQDHALMKKKDDASVARALAAMCCDCPNTPAIEHRAAEQTYGRKINACYRFDFAVELSVALGKSYKLGRRTDMW
jgi:hypothetical protein